MAARSNLPPSPRLPALVQTAKFLRDPFPLLADCYERFGPIFRLRLVGLGEWVFVGEPQMIKRLFKADPEAVHSGEINQHQLGFMLGTDATFSLDEDEHMTRRRLIHPFFNGKGAKEQIPLIRRRTLRAMESFPEGVFELQPWAHRLSLDILGNALFGASDEAAVDDLVETFDRFASEGLRSKLIMLPWLQIDLGRRSPWGKVLEMRRRVFAAVRELVRERLGARDEFGERDVASAIANTPDRNGEHLGEDSLVEELINDMFAGHETTGNVLAWCTECVASRPRVLETLRRELDEVLEDRPVGAEDLRDLPYLDAVIQEAIRFRPLAPMAGVRLTKEEFELGGYTLPPETIVVQCFPVMARREDLYERPETFDPDHFLENKPPAYHWNPFGGGRRMCLGKGLAEVELAVILAELFRRHDVEICQEAVYPVRDGVFFAPSEGLKVRVTPRSGQGDRS